MYPGLRYLFPQVSSTEAVMRAVQELAALREQFELFAVRL